MFKQSSAVLKLLYPHTNVFCINSYRCSDYYHFLQVDQFTHSFVNEYVYSIGSSQLKKKLKNQDERKERKEEKNLYSFQLVRVNIRHKLGISMPVRLRIILWIWVVTRLTHGLPPTSTSHKDKQHYSCMKTLSIHYLVLL